MVRMRASHRQFKHNNKNGIFSLNFYEYLPIKGKISLIFSQFWDGF